MTGLLRIGVNVEDRRVVERDSHGLEFGSQGLREPLSQALVTTAAQCDHRRPQRERRAQPRHSPTLLIDAHPQWQAVVGMYQRLRFARQVGNLVRRFDVAREQDDSAEIELTRQRLEVRWNRMARKSGYGKLTDVTTNVSK